MRKLILSFLLVSIAVIAAATNPVELFSLNEKKIAAEMADLTAIENHVNTENVTLSQLFAENNALAEKALLPSYGAASMASVSEGPPLGIPSFLWGFCFTYIGVGIVYSITENRAETNKALWGCVAGSVTYTILNVLFIFFMAAAL